MSLFRRAKPDDVDLPMEKSAGLFLVFVGAIVVSAFVLWMTLGAASRPSLKEIPRHVTTWIEGKKALLNPDSTEEPRREALPLRAEPAKGVYTSESDTMLPAEPETANASYIDESDPDAVFVPTAAEADARYRQYLIDQGYISVDDLQVRERTVRDANGNEIDTQIEIVNPK
jgi:hypothetical protein